MSSVRRTLYSGRQYLLRDDFNDDRAAGTLNGTPAVPGPGTRLVTDTGNNLSQSGGQLVCAGGVGWGDPGRWYGWLTRKSGRMLLLQINHSALASLHFGLDWNAAGVTDFGIYFHGAALETITGGLAVGAIADGITYTCLILLRTAGLFIFIKGGAYSSWTLAWPGTTGTGGGYPGIANSTAIFVADYIRVPARLWLPPVLAHDTFQRADT